MSEILIQCQDLHKRYGRKEALCGVNLRLESGKIVEEGTHQQLMQQGGQYSKMFEYQAYYYQKNLVGRPDEIF